MGYQGMIGHRSGQSIMLAGHLKRVITATCTAHEWNRRDSRLPMNVHEMPRPQTLRSHSNLSKPAVKLPRPNYLTDQWLREHGVRHTDRLLEALRPEKRSHAP